MIWEKQIIDSKKDTVGFSGAATFVSSDLMVIGQNGGEYPIEGKIFGINPKTGDIKWTFYTTGRDDPRALADLARGFVAVRRRGIVATGHGGLRQQSDHHGHRQPEPRLRLLRQQLPRSECRRLALG